MTLSNIVLQTAAYFLALRRKNRKHPATTCVPSYVSFCTCSMVERDQTVQAVIFYTLGIHLDRLLCT